MNYLYKYFAALLFLTICITSCVEPEGETSVPDIESLRYVYRKSMIERARRDSAVETPGWVKQLPGKFAKVLVEYHLYKEGPVWGLAKRYPHGDLPFDEVGSKFLIDFATDYNLWDKLPPLDKKKKEEALKFWQSWQDPVSGNFIDPKHPKRIVNEKFVKGLIHWFGGEPLYPLKETQQSLAINEEGTVNTKIFLERTKNDPDWEKGGWGVGSHTAKMAKELWYKINEGETELIPGLKLGMEQILEHQDPVSGLWGPPEASLLGRLGGTLKVMARFYHGMGIKVPYSKELANTIIKCNEEGEWNSIMDDFCTPVNVTILISYLLETSDYRKEELYKVLESILEGIRCHWFTGDGTPLKSYNNENDIGLEATIIHAIGIAGGYLNWKDSPIFNDNLESSYEQRGFGYKYIVKVNDNGKVEVYDITQTNTAYRD